MPEVKTDIVANFKTKGFAEAQQQAAKISREARTAAEQQVKGFDAMGKGAQAVDKELGRLQGRLKDLTKEQVAINRAMEVLGDTGAPAYKELNDELSKTQREAQQVERVMRSITRAFKEQTRELADQQAKGGFAQGLFQGAVPGAPFLQRGPGMRRQAAGMAVGRGIRGIAGGIAGAPFGGAQSIVQALSTIPGGGALAAPIARAMGQSQDFLQAEQTRMATMPFLGGLGMQQARRAARMRAGPAARAAGAQAAAAVGGPQESQINRLGKFYLEMEARETMGMTPYKDIEDREPSPEVLKMMGRLGVTAVGRQTRRRAIQDIDENLERERERKAEQAQARVLRRAEQRAQQAFLPNIRGMGANLMGAAAPQAQQFAAGITQVGGGFGRELGQGGFLRSAMAARTLFGVEAPTAGAFLQAGRRGGLAGGRGEAGGELRRALSDAMKLGLEGSEINSYLQQMAAGITEWRQTGIPVNRESTRQMAEGLGGLGLGGVRGTAVARGFGRAAESVSRRGPTNAVELLMMETLGGLDAQNMTPEAIEQAQIRMERKEFGGEDVTRFMQQMLRSTGGGALARGRVRGALGGLGIQVSAEEMRLMGRQMEGDLTDKDRQRLQELREQRERGARMGRVAETEGGLAAAAGRAVPAAVKRQARLQNQQIDTGRRMISSIQNMEKTANRITKEVADKVGPLMEKFSIGVGELTDAVIENTRTMAGGTPASNVDVGPG